MQKYSLTPIFSDIADWYAYPALTAGLVNDITISSPGGSNKGYITLQPQHLFVFCAFAAATNYDEIGTPFASALSSQILTRPSTPNNFTIEIQRASSNNYSNSPLTQAEVCSAGILSGKQVPTPVVYGSNETLSFQFTDLTGLFSLDNAGAPIPLSIEFWMLGYTVPETNWSRFQEYFPDLKNAYQL